MPQSPKQPPTTWTKEEMDQAIPMPIPESNVDIPLESIHWNIIPVVSELEDRICIDLEWGWTAGLTQDQLANIPDDCPNEKESVRTTLDLAEELRDKLTEIIDEHKERHLFLRKEHERKFNEKYPNWNKNLQKIIERQTIANRNVE